MRGDALQSKLTLARPIRWVAIVESNPWAPDGLVREVRIVATHRSDVLIDTYANCEAYKVCPTLREALDWAEQKMMLDE